MPDLPLTRALVAELCGLSAEDAQLPLPILVNLHRRQLRTPFEGLLVLARRHQVHPLPVPTGEPLYDEEVALNVINEAIYQLERDLGKRYPSLKDGQSFEGQVALTDLDKRRIGVAADVALPTPLYSDMLARALMLRQQAEWAAFETVVLLHRLTWREGAATVLPTLELLEAEFELDAAAGQIIHDMATLAC